MRSQIRIVVALTLFASGASVVGQSTPPAPPAAPPARPDANAKVGPPQNNGGAPAAGPALAAPTQRLPIHQAAMTGDLEKIQRELDSGVQIDVPVIGGEDWHRGSTPLMWAARMGPLKSVEFLLSKGANARMRSSDGTTALMLATAARDDVPARIKALLDAGAPVNDVRLEGGTALFWAATNCTVPGVTAMLLNAGAKVDQRRPRDGTTALMGAARFGNEVAIREFAAAGADMNIVSLDGFTPLHWACAGESGNTATIRALLGAGATLDARSKEGSTPLMIAAAKGGKRRVRELLEAGADAGAVNARGDTATMAAAKAGDAQSLFSLLEKGASATAANADGVTPLHLAVISVDPASVRLLLQRGADPKARNADGWTPILLAKNIAVLEPLIEAGADVNERASQAPNISWTPLMFAASEGDLLSIRRLLRAGADPGMTDLLGTSALSLAAANNDDAAEQAVEILAAAAEKRQQEKNAKKK